MSRVSILAIWIVCAGLAAGCARQPSRGVAEVAECRQAANAVTRSEFEPALQALRRQADAYAECMESRGYTLDLESFDQKLTREEQVKNAAPLGGDPSPYLAVRRQQLRMSPKFWRPARPGQS